MQKDEVLMGALRRVGALPDKTVTVGPDRGGLLVGSGGETAEIFPEAADHIFVAGCSEAVPMRTSASSDAARQRAGTRCSRPRACTSPARRPGSGPG